MTDPKELDRMLSVQQAHQLTKLRLPKNLDKDHWYEQGFGTLFRFLEQEVSELRAALESGNPGDVAEEAADVANFCGMIIDLAIGRECICHEPVAHWCPEHGEQSHDEEESEA